MERVNLYNGYSRLFSFTPDDSTLFTETSVIITGVGKEQMIHCDLQRVCK